MSEEGLGGVWSLGCHMDADAVEALLAKADKDNEGRPDFENGIDRDRAKAAIHAILWAYSSRPSDTACCYAWTNLWGALRVDMASLKFIPTNQRDPA